MLVYSATACAPGIARRLRAAPHLTPMTESVLDTDSPGVNKRAPPDMDMADTVHKFKKPRV